MFKSKGEIVENTSCQTMKHEYLKTFLKFLESNSSVQELLVYDVCFTYADKYLLAVVFNYLLRLQPLEYDEYTFFLALALAHDIEEDENDLVKDELYLWALGINWRKNVRCFEKDKMAFFTRLDYRASVTHTWCKEVFEMVPEHSAWKRNRNEAHSGAQRKIVMKIGNSFIFAPEIQTSCIYCSERAFFM